MLCISKLMVLLLMIHGFIIEIVGAWRSKPRIEDSERTC